jgi:hypothetical protein
VLLVLLLEELVLSIFTYCDRERVITSYVTRLNMRPRANLRLPVMLLHFSSLPCWLHQKDSDRLSEVPRICWRGTVSLGGSRCLTKSRSNEVVEARRSRFRGTGGAVAENIRCQAIFWSKVHCVETAIAQCARSRSSSDHAEKALTREGRK